ncbi:hypothetical protein EDB85DRAFT_1896807 [Lactarius pseudohatsudake]|nr:hypothetical protein EDB85DRAFT_1896807 [Lactarius pseudohatsudake]
MVMRKGKDGKRQEKRGDRKWLCTLSRDAKHHRGGRLDPRRAALESLRPRGGAARWGTWETRGEKSKCAKCAMRPKDAKDENGKRTKHTKCPKDAHDRKRKAFETKRAKHTKRTKDTMSNQKAWGHSRQQAQRSTGRILYTDTESTSSFTRENRHGAARQASRALTGQRADRYETEGTFRTERRQKGYCKSTFEKGATTA